MYNFFARENSRQGDSYFIIGTDYNHIKNVLRLSIGEKIKICDKDNSKNYVSEIAEITNQEVKCTIIEEVDGEAEGNVELHIYQGLPKADKMELILQKGTELGVSKFIPVALKRCIVKLDGKDAIKKIERWQKITEVASKQSGRDIVPEVANIETINDICNKINDYDLVMLAYELEENNYIKTELLNIKNTKENYKIAIVIGPEGGIDDKEAEKLKEAGAKIVSLGKRILRTETVALQVSSIVMYELENGGN